MTPSIDCAGSWEFRLQCASEAIAPAFTAHGYCHAAWGLIDVPARGDAAGPWDAGLSGDGPWIGLYRRELAMPPGGWAGWRLQLASDGPPPRLWWDGRELGATARPDGIPCPADGGAVVLVALAVAGHPRRRSPIHAISLLRRSA